MYVSESDTNAFSLPLMLEVMANPYVTPEEEIGFDPQSKRDALSLPHSARANSQQETVDRTIGTITSTTEGEGQSRSSTRRRIPVACNRCRKRKIKCSGDVGNGLGCVNCRTSGNTNCHFLRVNSSVLQTKVLGWPYPPTNATLSSSHQRQGMYAPQMAPKQELLSNPSNFRFASFPRPPAFDMGAAESHQSYSRPSFGHDHTVSYEDETSNVYGSQPPTYVVPTSPQGALPDYCGLSWSKTWHSGLNAHRAPSGGFLPDHEVESAFHHSNDAYIFPGSGSQSSETSFVPSMIALSSEGQGAGRTLPNPSGRCLLQMGSQGFPTSSEVISALPQQECKIGHPWTVKSVTPNNIRPVKQCTSGSFNTSPIVRTKPAPSNPHDMVLRYLPTTSASASPPLMPSSGTYTRLNPGDTGEELRSNEEARVSRPTFRDHSRLALLESNSDIYGYCSPEKSRKGPKPGASGSVATLMNGLPYTRPPAQLQSTQLTFSLPLADSLADTRSPTDARTQAFSYPGAFYSEAC